MPNATTIVNGNGRVKEDGGKKAEGGDRKPEAGGRKAAESGEPGNGVFSPRFNCHASAGDVTRIVEDGDAATNGAAWTGIATNAFGLWGGATNVIETGTGSPVSVTVQDAGPPGGAATNRVLRIRNAAVLSDDGLRRHCELRPGTRKAC